MASDVAWGQGAQAHTFPDNFNSGDNGWDNKGAFSAGDGFTNGDISQDARNFDGGMSGGGDDRLCYNCNQPGHTKAECTAERVQREFTGECRGCGETGHMKKDCPNKPKFCHQCKAENDHDTIDCTNKKVIDTSGVADMTIDEAWAAIREASEEKEVADFKEALKAMSKSAPDMTYVDIEKGLRQRKLNFYLIGLKKEVGQAYTNTDLQGEVGKTYTLGIYTKSSCPRAILADSWPPSIEENLKRLEDTGVPLERGIPICSNCNELGHTRKACKEESTAPEKTEMTCVLCDQPGHRARDCTEERPKPKGTRTCRHCDSPDHLAAECPDKPAPKVFECRNCWETGHKAADCTNERVMKCRNCDGIGHMSKECTQPKDWSRVTCRHCGKNGHASEKMCDPADKEAFAAKQAEEAAANGGSGFDGGFDSGNAVVDNSAAWDSGNTTSVADGGSWDGGSAATKATGGW